MAKQIPVGQNNFALIDDEDFERVSRFVWSVNNGYAINQKSQPRQMHRYVMDAGLFEDTGLVVDHINRNRLDNRRSNLRICSVTENNRNKDFEAIRQRRITPIAAIGSSLDVRVDSGIVASIWRAKEQRDGKAITIQDVVRGANLNTHTVVSIKNGAATRFDAEALNSFCDYFDVPAGAVPFLVYTPDKPKGKGK